MLSVVFEKVLMDDGHPRARCVESSGSGGSIGEIERGSSAGSGEGVRMEVSGRGFRV